MWSQLVLSLRFRQPNREILLFTEFLPENKIWGKTIDEPLLPLHKTIWRAATAANIPVIGMEPEFVEKSIDATVNYRLAFGGYEEEFAWATIEGARLRNKRWLETLRAYRKNHPNALFVIYTGAGHVEYTEPYSLGRELAGENTLVAEIYPRVIRSEYGRGKDFLIDDFDVMTQGAFPQRILWFADPAIAQRAGFNIRVKIPTPSQY